MNEYMQYDDLVWEKSEAEYEVWWRKICQRENLMIIGRFIAKHRYGVGEEIFKPVAGAFNLCIRMLFKDGGSAMLRFPQPGSVRFPEEKVRKEVAVMRYVAEHTAIPVPFVLHHGTKEEGPAAEMGPFLLMDYIAHSHHMADSLNTPGFLKTDRPVLDPNVPDEKLRSLYGQMADILLQLLKPSFSLIGSLEELEDGNWSVTDRPLTFNMNELVELGNFPPQKFPTTTFSTSASYFTTLTDINIIHLQTQRNDCIKSEDDCRRKYVARHLFRKLAREGRLKSIKYQEQAPFKLFCDDLWPTNVLMSEEDAIVGVID